MTTEPSNRDRTAPRKVWSVYYLAFPENGCQSHAVTEQSTVTDKSLSSHSQCEWNGVIILKFDVAEPFFQKVGGEKGSGRGAMFL